VSVLRVRVRLRSDDGSTGGLHVRSWSTNALGGRNWMDPAFGIADVEVPELDPGSDTRALAFTEQVQLLWQRPLQCGPPYSEAFAEFWLADIRATMPTRNLVCIQSG
jgi:hypothetical protein